MNQQPKPSKQNDMPVIQLGPRRGGGPMAGRMNAEKPKHTKQTLFRLMRYIGRNGFLLLALVFIMLAVTGAELLGPFFQAKAIDTIYLGACGHIHVDFDAMKGYLLLMAVISKGCFRQSWPRERCAPCETIFSERFPIFPSAIPIPTATAISCPA